MPQINLLKQSGTHRMFWESFTSVVVKILFILVLVVIGIYGYLFFKYKTVVKQVNNAQAEITSLKAKISSEKNRDELVTRQAQAEAFKKILGEHIYWSRFFPELAKLTIKNTKYLSIKAISEGELDLSLSAPSVVELEKFLQAMDMIDINTSFSNVKISGINKSQQGDSLESKFEIKMDFDPQLLKYEKPDVQTGNNK